MTLSKIKPDMSLIENQLNQMFDSLPKIEVTPSTVFSEILENSQKNTVGCTLLQSEGATVAGLFNVEQLEGIKETLLSVPKLLAEMINNFETIAVPKITKELKLEAEAEYKAKLGKVASEIISKVNHPLKKAQIMMGCGAALLLGAYLLKTISPIRINKASAEKQSEASRSLSTHSWKKIASTAMLLGGLGLIASSIFLTHRVSLNTLAMSANLKG